jgi:NADH-quinone oxidoreductase subunit M
MAIAVPTGVKIFNWVATMWRGHVRYRTPLLYAIGFVTMFMIGGFSGLGLPGLAGFVAEIQIFVGAFTLDSWGHRIMTILAAASVVTSAVYLLRALTKMLYGPLVDEHHSHLTDATFVERVPLTILIFCLAFAGIFPAWMVRMISYALAPVMTRLQDATF